AAAWRADGRQPTDRHQRTDQRARRGRGPARPRRAEREGAGQERPPHGRQARRYAEHPQDKACMMARLIDWPNGLPWNAWEPLSGPRTVGAGATESIGGYTRTVSSPFGLWRLRFQFANMRGQIARRYRGWVTALHGGANATRVPFCDWDGLSFPQMGVTTTHQQWKQGQPWGNGEPWDNGQN